MADVPKKRYSVARHVLVGLGLRPGGPAPGQARPLRPAATRFLIFGLTQSGQVLNERNRLLAKVDALPTS
jgi:hypothetical protein